MLFMAPAWMLLIEGIKNTDVIYGSGMDAPNRTY